MSTEVSAILRVSLSSSVSLTVYASSKVQSSSCSRSAVNAPVSWAKVSLNGFGSSCGTDVFSLGFWGRGGGSGPGLEKYMQVSDILANIGAWSASPDVFRISVEGAISVHMDFDMSMSSILLSWLLSVLWRKVYRLCGCVLTYVVHRCISLINFWCFASFMSGLAL